MFTGFSDADFAVFEVDGLDGRMAALIETIRPKLYDLGNHFAPYLSVLSREEMFVHVAKHARRTVHPPKDTWVAWAKNKRGYKALPHFQIGLWQTHVFIQFTIIYECTNKNLFAEQMSRVGEELLASIPQHFYWSLDHTKPDVRPLQDLSAETLEHALHRLRHNKNAEFLCGLQIPASDPLLKDGQAFLSVAEQAFSRLLPLYQVAF